jgi:RNA polymerase sigma-70 factor (ECF subfamily)
VSSHADAGPGHAAPDREPDDRALLARHLAGDDDAFGALFARHRDRLWAVALRTTGNPDDAADALQEAMISAFRRAGSYRGDAAVTTWLHRIVVNASLDRIRRRSVRAAEPLPDDPAAGAADLPADLAAQSDPELAAQAGERRRAVLAALAGLPVEQRAALVLVDMEGFTVAEAADILGAAVGTVKSRCSRGRARLLPLLAAYGPDPSASGGNDRTASRVRSARAATGAPTSGDPRPEGGGSDP